MNRNRSFATAVQYDLRINKSWWSTTGMYGTIRMHQEPRLSRAGCSARSFRTPDFRRLCAGPSGGFGATVERTADFAEAFAAGRSASGKAPRSSISRSIPKAIHADHGRWGAIFGQRL